MYMLIALMPNQPVGFKYDIITLMNAAVVTLVNLHKTRTRCCLSRTLDMELDRSFSDRQVRLPPRQGGGLLISKSNSILDYNSISMLTDAHSECKLPMAALKIIVVISQ